MNEKKKNLNKKLGDNDDGAIDFRWFIKIIEFLKRKFGKHQKDIYRIVYVICLLCHRKNVLW